MPRTRPPAVIQPAPTAHDAAWPELALLAAYLVICLISVLTVLTPTTENEKEHGTTKTTASDNGTHSPQ
jgi:hypothetical protein